MTPFRRRRGRIEATFELDEGQMLANLASQVIELLHDRHAPAESDADPLDAQVGMSGPLQAPEDPVLRRLLPDGYPGDDDDAAEFRRYTEQSLTIAKVNNARVVLDSLNEAGINESPKDGKLDVQVDESQVQAWLTALNDMRLSLAVRLGVGSEDSDDNDTERSDDSESGGQAETGDEGDESEKMMHDVYDWLGYVQESLVSVLG